MQEIGDKRVVCRTADVRGHDAQPVVEPPSQRRRPRAAGARARRPGAAVGRARAKAAALAPSSRFIKTFFKQR